MTNTCQTIVRWNLEWEWNSIACAKYGIPLIANDIYV